MKIIYNKTIPFRGFKAINLLGILFVRTEFKGKVDEKTLTHELIHSRQMKELLYFGFYVWYIVEWCIRCLGSENAYRNICFEREAYANENDTGYLKKRKPFAFVKDTVHIIV